MLKKGWKVLRYFDFTDIKSVKHIIMVCCILHNLSLGPDKDQYSGEQSDDEADNKDYVHEESRSAKELRDLFTKRMFQECNS